MSLNKVMLIGNVGKDPEVRYLDGNSANGANAKVATLTLATTERFKDRSGELREKTEWHNIVAWRNLADLSEKYIRKGSQIYVEGKLTTRSWTDQSGNKRYTTEIVADTIQLLGKRSDNPASSQPAQPSYQQPSYQQQGGYQQPGFQQSPFQSAQPAAAPAVPDSMDNPADDLPF